MDINLRRLYTVLASTDGVARSGIVASLDIEKAFDSVEWNCLWEVLQRFRFRPTFISWVQAVYKSPMARVRTGTTLSPPFLLHRGTRQGCSLCPLLFTLAIEPMVNLLWSSPEVQGKSPSSKGLVISRHALCISGMRMIL